MKTNITKGIEASYLSQKSVQINATRARARAREKQGRDTQTARLAARDMFNAPAGRGALLPPKPKPSQEVQEDEVRAIRAGLLSLAEIEAITRTQEHEEKENHERAALMLKRSAWQLSDQSAHVSLWSSIEQGKEDAARARRFEAIRADGLWGAVAMAPLGENQPRGARELMERLRVESTAGIGDGWHEGEAIASGAALAAMVGNERRAAALAILAQGKAGRASARGSRLALSVARRWMRRNSRREAANLLEVGGAAGVDDRGAWSDWTAELVGIARGVHLRAAMYAATIAGAALPPCAALVARGMTGGALANLQAATMGRGVRADGLPVVEWTEKGRTVREDSIGIRNRGAVWIWAARQSGREMHAARYGRGGRDGREVPAQWTASGTIKGADFGAVHRDGQTIPQTITRRPSAVREIRAALAASLREARQSVADARWQAMQAKSPAEKVAAGAAIGGARRSLVTASAAARNLRTAMEGGTLDPSAVSRWLSDSGALTSAGRMFAKRFRDKRATATAERLELATATA